MPSPPVILQGLHTANADYYPGNIATGHNYSFHKQWNKSNVIFMRMAFSQENDTEGNVDIILKGRPKRIRTRHQIRNMGNLHKNDLSYGGYKGNRYRCKDDWH